MSVTIKQIAELCGVSHTTVGRVLNKQGNVSPETAKKIETIAESLGYTRNKAATALAVSKKNIKIGIITFSEENIFFDEVLLGIQSASKEYTPSNSQVILKEMKGYDIEKQIQLIDELLVENITALLITPINDPLIATKLTELHNLSIPVITFNTDIENTPRLCYVGADHFKGGELAGGLLRLLRPTCCKVGIITGSNKSLAGTQRIKGFKYIIETELNDAEILGIVENNDDDIEAFDVTKQLLMQNPSINTLYLTAAGTYGAYRAVKTLNKLEEITIICCDAIPNTKKLINTHIIAATICQQPFIQGYRAVKIIFDYLIYGSLPAEESLVIHNEIKIKENI